MPENLNIKTPTKISFHQVPIHTNFSQKDFRLALISSQFKSLMKFLTDVAKPIIVSLILFNHLVPSVLFKKSAIGCKTSTPTNINASCIDCQTLDILIAWSALSLSLLALSVIIFFSVDDNSLSSLVWVFFNSSS